MEAAAQLLQQDLVKELVLVLEEELHLVFVLV
jgi:hypothetical protein